MGHVHLQETSKILKEIKLMNIILNPHLLCGDELLLSSAPPRTFQLSAEEGTSNQTLTSSLSLHFVGVLSKLALIPLTSYSPPLMKIVAGFMFNYLLTFYSQRSALATTAESFLFHSTLFTDIKKIFLISSYFI